MYTPAQYKLISYAKNTSYGEDIVSDIRKILASEVAVSAEFLTDMHVYEFVTTTYNHALQEGVLQQSISYFFITLFTGTNGTVSYVDIIRKMLVQLSFIPAKAITSNPH